MKVVLKIAYDGGAFSGFQRQSELNSVQGTLEAALAQVLNAPVVLQGAGRTDLGVHATGQVVAFVSDRVGSAKSLCHSVNSVLRDPAAVLEAALLDPDDPFHPRYDALARTYSYFIVDGCGPREKVFWVHRAWTLPQTVDLQRAQEAASLFLGQQDFSTFSYRMQEMESRVRQVSGVSLTAQEAPPFLSPDPGPRILRLSITANGFLRRMVRLLAASIVEVGLGLRGLKELERRLEARDPALAPHPAPASGLYLERIDYHPDPFGRHRGTDRHAMAKLHSTHRFKR